MSLVQLGKRTKYNSLYETKRTNYNSLNET